MNVINYLFFFFCTYTDKGKITVNCFGQEHCKKCHVAIRNCFLSGTPDMQKCMECEEKLYNIKPCMHHSNAFLNKLLKKETFVELNEQEYLTKENADKLIDEIIVESMKLKMINMQTETGKNKVNYSKSYTEKLLKLCLYSNFNDNYENAKHHKQATVNGIAAHIQRILKDYITEDDINKNYDHIYNSITNPALCLRNPEEWTKDRVGFEDDTSLPSVGILSEKMIFKPYEYRNLRSSMYTSSSKGSASCNRTACNRFDDPNECESQIRVFKQGGW
ncbi:serine repeat antigen 8 [Hepatocystis sp. ex Piliocolobus tephrosceles]|nr:serine repeat antigen 8 [Hepatocystis sp. ex Piliocolobus tephrosceles]